MNFVGIIHYVKNLWNRFRLSSRDLANATPDPVESGDDLKTAVLKLQAQVDQIISSN